MLKQTANSASEAMAPARWRRWLRRGFWAVAGILVLLLATGVFHRFKSLPAGLSFAGPARSTSEVRFLRDLTFLDRNGERHVEQEIFDAVFQMIDEAEDFILIDMFLFNDFQGAKPEKTRALCAELTEKLLARKAARPAMEIHVITDPINTVYGGLKSPHLEQLKAADIDVTVTDLTKLRDSNPAWSAGWRWFIGPFGNSEGSLLPNPFGAGRVSVRSYLAMLNFKANHRKVIVADGPHGMVGLVTSANPHDGSSAHGNVALQFSGAAANDLLETEAAVLRFSGGPQMTFVPPAQFEHAEPADSMRVKIVSEQQIENEAIAMMNRGGWEAGSNEIRLVMFYLSDRRIISALKRSAEAGATLKIILDPNKDAFGHEKGGIPNRQVAAELMATPGIEIRWADTHGEQCHSKMLLVHDGEGQASLLIGSANYTRRNLDDFNLELNAAVTGPAEAEVFRRAQEYFDDAWTNAGGRTVTTRYETYQDDSSLKYWRYRLMEATGLSTF